MTETWKDIPGYEGLYQASTMGRIRSIDRTIIDKNGNFKNHKGCIRKYGTHHKNNVFYVHLNKDGKRIVFNVHKLIALTFISERPEGYHVCHLNGDNQDNRLVNLRYDTQSQNEIDRYRQGRKNGSGKMTVEQVMEIRKLYATGDYKQTELSTKFNISQDNISRIVNRKTFTWLNEDGSIDESKTKVS